MFQHREVLYNVMLLHPFLAAKQLGIRTASFSTYPGPGTPMHLYAQKFEEREAFDDEIAQHPSLIPANEIALKVFGVDVLKSQLQCRFFSDEVNIVFNIPQLQGPVNEYQQRRLELSIFHWVGTTDPQLSGLAPRVEPELDSELPWSVEPGTKVLLVSLGSLTVEYRWDAPEHLSSVGWTTGKQYSLRLWSELLETFGGREDVRVILSIGQREEAREVLGELPSNFQAFKFLDQVAVLRRCDAFVTHGGANSIKEATLLGVPMIVTPFCVDQPTNGEAVERYGAGLCFSDLMATPRGIQLIQTNQKSMEIVAQDLQGRALRGCRGGSGRRPHGAAVARTEPRTGGGLAAGRWRASGCRGVFVSAAGPGFQRRSLGHPKRS
eukprot:s2797_g5.t1